MGVNCVLLDILYVSTLCSANKNKNLLETNKTNTGQQAYKFNRLITQGLIAHNNVNVIALTSLPINRKITKQILFKREYEISDGMRYCYTCFINVMIIRQILLIIDVFRCTLKLLNSKMANIIICDVLSFSALVGCLIGAKIKKCKVIGIVSDIPTYRVGSLKLKGIKRLIYKVFNITNLFFAQKCDGYVLITEEMNKIVNPQKKPYVVIEGMVDSNMVNSENLLLKKYKKKVCHYAGGLNKLYGLENLVQAFIELKFPNAELHIYGGGPYANELQNITKHSDLIKFFGYVSNDIIVQEQLKSTLLINPRLTNEEYTKYSFPSKNLEYMASGTPTMTTKLFGMPKEYENYVYIIRDESKDGIKKSLHKILSKTKEELHDKGRLSKEFVLKEKNNISQAQKIIKICKIVMRPKA